MFRIQTMNKISPLGLDIFPQDKYEIANDVPNPDAILVRSADLNSIEIPHSVLAIARAGAGYNNIPVKRCSESGIVVFNTPGANANAVKELALAALLISSRDIVGGINWVSSVVGKGNVPELVEKEKSKYTGPEIRGKTLGVIGLGAIGVMVANDAVALGMEVIGFDPYISVDAAWNLSRKVARADTLEGIISKADYITLHIPLTDATKGFLDMEKFILMKKGARIVNLSRAALVKDKDVIEALESGILGAYVTDFPNAELLACKKVIGIPHLGASTPEAEDNCAIMAARQLMDYLETGAIRNSVNFSRCRLDQRSPHRLLVINRNIPNMVGQITTSLAGANINIQDLINHHCDEYGYNIIDTGQQIPASVLDQIRKVDGIIRVRYIER
uniref:D-3-phosphoglycerate dehydrogenase n=1 Tax=uncultured bacterium contig00031 TaxID=1181520 RepID=A0A806KM69_9BACT|nr:D-3-phosphoglycerate dehydrogenase [uncultured bacterium contig00031]